MHTNAHEGTVNCKISHFSPADIRRQMLICLTPICDPEWMIDIWHGFQYKQVKCWYLLMLTSQTLVFRCRIYVILLTQAEKTETTEALQMHFVADWWLVVFLNSFPPCVNCLLTNIFVSSGNLMQIEWIDWHQNKFINQHQVEEYNKMAGWFNRFNFCSGLLLFIFAQQNFRWCSTCSSLLAFIQLTYVY